MLFDICPNLEAGQTIGIIGQTGAAKNRPPFVQLIPRLYEATKGCVYVDDVPVREYPLSICGTRLPWCCRKYAFSGTVRDNSSLGQRGRDAGGNRRGVSDRLR